MWPSDSIVLTIMGNLLCEAPVLMRITKCHQSFPGRSGEQKIIKISHLHTFALQAGLDLSNVVAASTCNPLTSQSYVF